MINADKVPWLPHLPTQAKGSLYEFGRYLLTLTPAYEKGTIKPEHYDEHCWPCLRDIATGKHVSVEQVLIKVCAAFAYSPLALMACFGAVMRCIYMATREALLTKRTYVSTFLVELQMINACAGCGREALPKDSIYHPQYGKSISFCSMDCMTVRDAICHMLVTAAHRPHTGRA